MAYNPQTNLFNPQVGPDTGEGLARGIAQAGQSIGDYISMYGQYKGQQANRAEDRMWQQQDQQAQWGREDMRYGRSQADAAMLKQEKELDEMAGADAALAASLAAYEPFLPKGMVDVARKATSPAAKKALADTIGRYGADMFQKAAEAERDAAKAAAAKTWTPIPNTEYVGNANGSTLPVLQQQAGLPPDQLSQLGLEPEGYKAPNGMTWSKPKKLPAPAPDLFMMKNEEGATIGFKPMPPGYIAHPTTGEPTKIPSGQSEMFFREQLKRQATQTAAPADTQSWKAYMPRLQ